MREDGAGGGTAVVAGTSSCEESGVGDAGGGVCVAVSVGCGVAKRVTVAVGVSNSNSAGAEVGTLVSLACPEGWKGVGVGDGFGSCVIR